MTDSSGSRAITGLVASVLNERELAINIGANFGVRPGMIFKVLADRPVEIRDPSSNAVLGEVDREKVRVKASEVHPLFSICRTYRTRYVGLPLAHTLAEITGPYRAVTESLKAEDSELPKPLSERESIVKRGDRVVQVVGEEKDS